MHRISWNVLFSNGMRAQTAAFALGVLSARQFADQATAHGVGGVARKALKERGKTDTRKLARRALRRRSILNSYNLVNGV
jgi:hypothetical protein